MSKKPLKVIAGAPDRPLVIGDIEIPCYVVGKRCASVEPKGNGGGPWPEKPRRVQWG